LSTDVYRKETKLHDVELEHVEDRENAWAKPPLPQEIAQD